MTTYQQGFDDALVMLDEYTRSRRELADRFRSRNSPLTDGLTFNAELAESVAHAVRGAASLARKANPDIRDREIELLRGAVRVLGDNCDVARGEPSGACAGRQFAAIDRELGRWPWVEALTEKFGDPMASTIPAPKHLAFAAALSFARTALGQVPAEHSGCPHDCATCATSLAAIASVGNDVAMSLLREWAKVETEYADDSDETTCGECRGPRTPDGEWRFTHTNNCLWIRTRIACGLPVPF